MSKSVDAVIAGHLCLDVIPELPAATEAQLADRFQPGKLSHAGPITFSTGGAVSNTGLSLNRLGVTVRLMGMVGDDLFGHAIRQIVGAHGRDLVSGMIVHERSASSYTIIISPPGIDRIFLHHPGANDVFSADDIAYEAVAEARLFHFGYPPLMKRMYEDGGAGLRSMFSRVRRLGVTTSLDMAVPDASSAAGRADWRAIVEGVMPFVDLFLPSIEECLYMLDRDTYDSLMAQSRGAGILDLVTPGLLSDLSDLLLRMGARIVGFKLGHRGFYVRTADCAAIAQMGAARPASPDTWASREMWAPVFAVEVVGTTGAGDATIAGFLTGLLRGCSLEDAVTAAVAVGACNVEAADALGGVRSWEDTWRRVRAGWRRRELNLDAPGWRFDETHGHWVSPGQGEA